MVEFRTFRGAWWSFAPSVCVVAGMAHSVFLRKILSQPRVFSPFGFLCLQGFFVPSLIWKPAAVHIFLLNTLCTLRLFSVYVCETLFYCAFFVRNSFFALSLRENCLVARCFRKLTYKVLVIQCIIIRRCIFGRFICICRLVCGVTEEWICC